MQRTDGELSTGGARTDGRAGSSEDQEEGCHSLEKEVEMRDGR